MKLQISYIFLLLSLGGLLMGQSKEDLQAEKQKAFNEIKLARKLMERTSRERVGSLQQIRIVQKGINSRATLITTLEKEISL